MPYPLPKGKNFSITELKTTASHHMPIMCAAYEFYELGFLIEGARKSVTADNIYFSHSGSVTITAPDLMHQTSSLQNAGSTYHRILIKFSIEAANQITSVAGKQLLEELCSRHVLNLDSAHSAQILQMFYDMLEEYNYDSDYTDVLLTGMLLRLLVSLQRWQTENASSTIHLKENHPAITNALLYIDTHATESPSIKETAAEAGLTPAYFSRLFKKVIGCTYSDYLAISKLLFARSLLMETTMSLNEIALATGFSSGNYLSTVFHQHFHLTTTEYKKKYAGSNLYPD